MKGYLRKDGRKGIRNRVLVAYTVECAHFVASSIADSFSDADVHLVGFGGCAPNEYANLLMERLCTHPNVGAVLLVSLGCENMDGELLRKKAGASGRPAGRVVIQEAGGTRAAVEAGRKWVEGAIATLRQTPVCELSWNELTVGTICGGSDASSGIAANPAVGLTFDALVDLGARCIFEEPGELLGCEESLRQRGADPRTGEALAECIRKADRYYKAMGHDSFSEGNATGGLTTIEEKSYGSYAKSGSRTISGLLYPCDIPPAPGLYLMDVVPDGEARWGFPNVSDNAEIIELIATGCQIVLFTTGRGSVVGSAISPVIKVCGNPLTYAHMEEDMDVNAGAVISDGRSLEEIRDVIMAKISACADGVPSKSEALGHREFALEYKYFNRSEAPGCPLR